MDNQRSRFGFVFYHGGGGGVALQKNNQEPNQIMGSSSVADGGIFIYIYNYCALESSGISCSRKRIEC